MSKVFVIPDVHLKPWMFEKASELIAKGSYDAIVMLYSNKVFQVVGHTPVRSPLLEGNLLTLDTFSTYRDGSPYGDQRFVWIDMVKKTWEYVEK